MSESPLFRSPNHEFPQNYEALDSSDLLKFHSLYNFISRKRGDWSNINTEAAQGIWETNKFAITADEDAVFAEASKFNHSCSPNAKWLWKEDIGQIVIMTLTDIERGQEILISYINFDERQTVINRRLQLLDWRFLCRCERCIVEDGETDLRMGLSTKRYDK